MVRVFVGEHIRRHLHVACPREHLAIRLSTARTTSGVGLLCDDAQLSFFRVEMTTADLSKRYDRGFVQHPIDFVVQPVHPVREGHTSVQVAMTQGDTLQVFDQPLATRAAWQDVAQRLYECEVRLSFAFRGIIWICYGHCVQIVPRRRTPHRRNESIFTVQVHVLFIYH